MLSLGGSHRVYLCAKPVDFRKAHDGLCAIVRDQFRDDPFSGDVFVFHNAARDRIKLLVWDKNGFWLCYKRLEQGTFPFAGLGDGARVEIERPASSALPSRANGEPTAGRLRICVPPRPGRGPHATTAMLAGDDVPAAPDFRMGVA